MFWLQWITELGWDHLWGDRADVFVEDVIKNRTVSCFVFQFTAGVTGIGLLLLRGANLTELFNNLMLGLKFLLLVVIIGLLSYVANSLQPKIDSLFNSSLDKTIPDATANQIGKLRARRKKIASICLFCVLTISMLGVQAWAAFQWWIKILWLLTIALFTWRAYRSVTPYGWF